MPYKDYNKRLEYQREYNKTHPDKIRENSQKYLKAHPKLKKEYNLKYNYGLSITEFDNLLLAQDNKCPICGQPLDLQNPHNVNVDHDHLTGKVRGILCRNCNLAIGFLRDNPEYAKRASEYLERD